jgi:flagellar biosynthesis protein FlhF
MATSDLYVKSYFAGTVREAMARARAELGPDALLLNTVETRPETRHLGEWEVVFGVRRNHTNSADLSTRAADPVKDLREQMEALGEAVRRMEDSKESKESKTASAIEEALYNAGVERRLAREIESGARQRLRDRQVVAIGRAGDSSARNGDELVRAVTAELESRLEVSPELARITAFAGPPGSGKTTALVKLAITKGVLACRPVQILSIDNRIGAAEQLAMYADILGVPFVPAETVGALAQAIASAPPNALLLIDTPGCTAASLREHAELAEFLKSSQDIDTQLVLTACTRQADLDPMVARFDCFGPAKLLFTRLDETDSMASVFSTAARTGLPLSFFSTGQGVPDDMAPATKVQVIAGLVNELPTTLRAVA